jgi:hypothetical protein
LRIEKTLSFAALLKISFDNKRTLGSTANSNGSYFPLVDRMPLTKPCEFVHAAEIVISFVPFGSIRSVPEVRGTKFSA